MGFELMTSSLPRMRSTPELHRLFYVWSGKRGSNSRPSAWKADALPTELLPRHKKVGGEGFEPPKVKTSRFTVCPSWPLWYPPKYCSDCLLELEPIEGFEPTTPRLQITCSGQLSYIGSMFFRFVSERDCKDRH